MWWALILCVHDHLQRSKSLTSIYVFSKYINEWNRWGMEILWLQHKCEMYKPSWYWESKNFYQLWTITMLPYFNLNNSTWSVAYCSTLALDCELLEDRGCGFICASISRSSHGVCNSVGTPQLPTDWCGRHKRPSCGLRGHLKVFTSKKT